MYITTSFMKEVKDKRASSGEESRCLGSSDNKIVKRSDETTVIYSRTNCMMWSVFQSFSNVINETL